MIGDAAIYAIMARVHKVIVPCSVLAAAAAAAAAAMLLLLPLRVGAVIVGEKNWLLLFLLICACFCIALGVGV